MELTKDFISVVTDKINKIKTPSPFFENTVCCVEPLHKITAYAVSKSRYSCENFYFDLDKDLEKTQEKNNIQDYINYISSNDAMPVLFISPNCFDIQGEIIDEIFERYKKIGDVAIFDKNNILFAYLISAVSNCETVLDIDDGKIKKYCVDYVVSSTLKELRERSQKLREEILAKHEENGVQFVSFDGVEISPLAKIDRGVVIYSGTIVKGNSVIGRDSVLGPNTVIDNSAIGTNCVINSSQVEFSRIDENVKLGPYCHLRPNCHIESGVHIGNFVEVKNSHIGKDTKAGHLTYVGDSDVGERVNFGCGCVTVNYNGLKKNRCNIGDEAFIGCNTNLIAPINIGAGAYTAAGSTLSIDIPPDALAISRAREQKIIESGAKKYRKSH